MPVISICPTGHARDEYVEPKTVSFVVKITMDDGAGQPDEIAWHGRVTHVPSGDGRYIKSLAELAAFIAIYLERLGAQVRPATRFRRQPWRKRIQSR